MKSASGFLNLYFKIFSFLAKLCVQLGCVLSFLAETKFAFLNRKIYIFFHGKQSVF